MPHHAPSFGKRAPLFPFPHVCCTGFLFFLSPFPRAEASWPLLPPPAVRASGSQGIQGLRSRALGWTSGLVWGHRSPAAYPFLSPASLYPLHSQLKPSSCSGIQAGLGQVGRRLCWACVLSPEGACSCCPLPCQSQAHVLPAHHAPLCPRQAEAEGPPCQRPGTALTLTLPVPVLCLRQHIWFIIIPIAQISSMPLTWEMWVPPGIGGLSVHPLHQAPGPCPLHSFFLQKTNLWSLPKKPCPTHTPTFPSSFI